MRSDKDYGKYFAPEQDNQDSRKYDDSAQATNNLNLSNVENNKKQEEDEIDLIELLQYYANYWKVILLALVIGVASGFAFQHFFVGTTYVSDASLFVVNSDQIISLTDLSLSSSLSKDYMKILKSRKTMKDVIKDLGLDMNYKQLSSLIAVTQDEDTHIITIKTTTDDKNLSRQITDSMVRVGTQRIQEVTTTGEASVVDYATSDAVVTQKVGFVKYPVLGGLLAVLIPLIILFIQFINDNSFKNEEEVLDKLKKPVLSTVPYYGKKNLIAATLTYFEKEAFNTLYGNIGLSGVENRVVAITSSNANEGKSSLSFKLAETITEYDKTVCYVDTDMRNSTFCNLYGIDKTASPGLSGYLSGKSSLNESLLQDYNNDKLFIMTTGKNPPNPSALLSNGRFTQLIKELRQRYDYVIVDTPPINPVIDGVLVAKECDGTIMVIESGGTDTRHAIRALNDLLMASVNVLGIVVNMVGKHKGYGYGYGYGKKYGYGYGYGKKYGYGYGYGYGHGGSAAAANTKSKSFKIKKNN